MGYVSTVENPGSSQQCDTGGTQVGRVGGMIVPPAVVVRWFRVSW